MLNNNKSLPTLKINKIKNKLKELLSNSYSPYSKFPVSCIVETKDNKYFYGVNVENASYGLTICAERNAILSAVTIGYKPNDFISLYCMTGTNAKTSDEISISCGACIQVINEFFDKNSKLYFFDNSDNYRCFSLSEISPLSFSKKDLK